MPPPRVRFAPSPTGFLHVGGARTALFNWLFARHHGGSFVLRIEDTDAARNQGPALQVILDGLRWLGLDWDEGPEVGGGYGPYFQTERQHLYQSRFEQLQAGGFVYEDDGAWRLKSFREPVVVDDQICGAITIDLADRATHPDTVIRRSDGSFIFHFANVVDDLEMGITHVIRGEDHLSNTPKHLEIFRALGAEPPRYAHIPLILNPDGSKMSKRDKGASIMEYLEGGFAPEAVRNYLCLLGWSPKDDREKLAIAEVIPLFDFAHVNRKAAAFDIDKCIWLNSEWLRDLPEERHRTLAAEALTRAGVPLDRFPPAYVQAALDTCRGKVRLLTELPSYAGFYFSDDFSFDAPAVGKQFTPENLPRLQAVRAAFSVLDPFDAAAIEVALKAAAAALAVKVGVLVHPTRLAVTGASAGPSLYHLLEVLGREKSLARIDAALARPEFSAL